MRILITGGYGFIGSYVAERFAKEGHEIAIIDDLSTGNKEYVEIKHDSYCLHTADEKCQMVFQNNNFDIVIHVAGQGCFYHLGNTEEACCKANVIGLTNILNLSAEYGVKKFIYISSTVVYGKTDMPAKEDWLVKPLTVGGINCVTGEEYCQRWRESQSLNTVVLRLANVYGPRQQVQSSLDVPGSMICNMLNGQDLDLVGASQDKADYIYVGDVVDAIYKVAISTEHSPILNIATSSSISLSEMEKLLRKIGKMGQVNYKDNPDSVVLSEEFDNSQAQRELNWQPKHSIADGLASTYSWYQKNHQDEHVQVENEKGRIFAKIRPFIENLMLALCMWGVSYANLYGGIMDFWVGLDYNYVYIAIMGLLYGKRQSLLATLFSGMIFINYMIARGADLVTLIYQAQYLAHLATYLCVGVVTGYVTNNRQRILSEKDAENVNLKERYEFLNKMYNQCLEIKDQLYSQIVNSDDSLGKIQSIAQELDSLRVEDIYTSAVGVISKILKVRAVDIYTVNHENSYLRLKVRSEDQMCFLPNSVKIADYSYVSDILQRKEVFINKGLDRRFPSMAAPVLHGGKVIAIVQLYKLPFESLSLYHINLLKITTLLIAGALARAYLHSSELSTIKYLPDTQILVPQEFEKVLEGTFNRNTLYKQSVALLRIVEKSPNYKQLYTLLAGVVRAEDYIGIKLDGYIYLLLSNISIDMIESVKKRLKNKGILVEGVDDIV